MPVTVGTAASGTYEQTLVSEILKEDAHTLFQFNGPKDLATWKDYCADLSGTELYKNIKSDDFVPKQAMLCYIRTAPGLMVIVSMKA